MKAPPKPYDFRQPQPEPPEMRRQLLAWLDVLARHWTDQGRRQFGLTWTLRIETVRRCYFQAVLPELPENTLFYPVQWSASAGSLLGVSRPLALALTLAMLGEKCDSLPADRPLTEVELLLWEHVLDHWLLEGARTCWQREPAPQWQRGERESAPQFSLVFRQQRTTLLADLHCEEPWADGRIVWLLTEATARQFFLPPGSDGTPAPSPQQVLQDIPLQLTVQLGQAKLPLAQLERLHSGDVLLLEQGLDEPLLVLLEGEPRYLAWPGRVGRQRAVQIAQLTEEQ